jgi:alpha,alpha-trehalose-phosphate synthase [UDP-forming]
MKKVLLLILPIVIVAAAVLTVFGFIQVGIEYEKQMDDLYRKARAVSDGMELSVKNILLSGDHKSAAYLVSKFQYRERVQGCAIYDKTGNVFSVTDRFRDWKETDKPYLKYALENNTPQAGIRLFKKEKVYSYVQPVTDDSNTVIGAIEIIYDTSYIYARLSDIWQRISIALLVLSVSIFFLAFFIQRQIFMLPIEQMTNWFRLFQKGYTEVKLPIKQEGELGKLASEVEQAALSLRVARKAVSEQAQVRLEKEDLWTEAKLRDLVHAKLGNNALVVVSNREPYMHVMDENKKEPRVIRPASGVVTAIDPIMRASGGIWVAHGSGNADRKFVNSKNNLGVPPGDIRYILKRVWLSKEQEEGYYYGFSNEGLWPLCHITHTRPIFRDTDWQVYQEVNRKFAEAVLEALPAKNPFVFIQDYHFALLPRLIKEKRPDATVALFWHIPWPNPEVFSVCPYQKEILDGMLGSDLIGFHVQFHCNNFLDTVNRMLESRVDTEKFSVVQAGKETFIRAFPISVDFNINNEPAGFDPGQAERLREKYEIGDAAVALSVDRIDYTKGIIERLHAIDRFFEKYPEYKGKVVFVQVAAPSRTHIKRYHDLAGEIDELVEKKNWKHSGNGWQPIIYLKRHFSPEEVLPFYKLADLCIVSSLHDGMNLVAKEYVSAKSDASGALVLSKFTGAARELTDAVLVNPYSIEEFADGIKLALALPAEEKKRRMTNMRKIVSENNVYRWAGGLISELTAIGKC